MNIGWSFDIWSTFSKVLRKCRLHTLSNHSWCVQHRIKSKIETKTILITSILKIARRSFSIVGSNVFNVKSLRLHSKQYLCFSVPLLLLLLLVLVAPLLLPLLPPPLLWCFSSFVGIFCFQNIISHTVIFHLSIAINNCIHRNTGKLLLHIYFSFSLYLCEKRE